MAGVPQDSDAVVRYLEGIARAFTDCVNTRRFDDAARLSGISEELRVRHDAQAEFHGHRAHVDNQRYIAENYPAYQNRIISINTTVNMNIGSARTFLLLEVTGFPTGVTRQSVVVLDAVRVAGGSWLYVTNTQMRGDKMA